MSDAIQIRGLRVRYGDRLAVRDLDMDVAHGAVCGFVGPNGAGKTTTIRVLLDLLRPEAGSVRVLGEDLRSAGGELRARLGFLPGDLALFPWLTGRETLDLFAGLSGRQPSLREEVLDRLGFPRDAIDRKVRTYSTGMRQMVGIACAFQHDPELLVLDEPTTGLDPVVRHAFLTLVEEAPTRGRTVFLSSHVLGEVEMVADTVILIVDGRIRFQGEVDEVRTRLPWRLELLYADGRHLVRSFDGDAGELLQTIETEGLRDMEIRRGALDAIFENGRRPRSLRGSRAQDPDP